jgi:membrane associated rhomboid family serine protease
MEKKYSLNFIKNTYKTMRGQFFPYKDDNPTKAFPIVTVLLILVNVVVFILSMFDYENIIMAFGFIPMYPSLITIISSMFLHGGIDHIFGNMWYLWIFGDNVEDRLGKIKYLALYFFSGFAATFAHFMTNLGSEVPSIGASGAISGVLGSYLVMSPQARVHVGRGATMPSYIVIGFWFVIQFFFASASLFGVSGSNVAFWAHVGGFVFGFAVTKLLVRNEKR